MTVLYRQVLNGTTFLRTTATPDGSVDAPEGSIVYDTIAAKRYKKVGTSWEEISPLTPLTPSNVPLHASKHIHGTIDEIDGDRLDVDFVPANYSATATGTGITGVTSTQHLTAHLKGIDDVLGSGIAGDKGPQGDPGPQGTITMQWPPDVDGVKYPFIFTPEEFGAVGDGTTDDTVAIQAAFDAAQEAGGILQFGAKVYKITAPIHTREGNVTVRGISNSGCGAIPFNNSNYSNYALQSTLRNGTVIHVFGPSAFIRRDGSPAVDGMTFQSLTFLGNGLGSKTPIDFGYGHTLTEKYTSATLYNKFIDIGVFNFEIGFDLSMQYGSTWRDCKAHSCGVGFQNGYTREVAQHVWSGGNLAKLTNVSVDACDICFYLTAGCNISIDTVLAEQNCGPLLYIRPWNPGYVHSITLHNVYYETHNTDRALIVLDGGEQRKIDGVSYGASASNITLSQVWMSGTNENVYGQNIAFKHINDTYGLSSMYTLRISKVIGVMWDFTVPSAIEGTTFERCRFRSLNSTNTNEILVSMCQVGNTRNVSYLKQNGSILYGEAVQN